MFSFLGPFRLQNVRIFSFPQCFLFLFRLPTPSMYISFHPSTTFENVFYEEGSRVYKGKLGWN